MEKTHATARVQVTLEIAVSDRWGSDCTVDQVYKQAAESALFIVRKLSLDGITVIGTPQVTAIMASRDR